MDPVYKRVVLKISGEALAGEKHTGFDFDFVSKVCATVKKCAEMGVQIGIVIGGGNIFRGLTGAKKGFDRVKGDQMGMLATIINSLALQSALEDNGVRCKVLTSIRMEPIGEYYSKARAIEYLEAGYVVIVGGGTSNPYFTTDSASALRGIEIEADVMLKGTRVDGDEIRRNHVRGGPRPPSEGHGPHGLHALPRERPPDHRLRHGHRGQPRQGPCRREDRNAGKTVRLWQPRKATNRCG